MDVKFGKVKSYNNIFLSASEGEAVTNFFAPNSNQNKHKEQTHQSFSPRINDLDSNILEQNAYQEMPDELFKLEHKIGMLEQLISKLDTEIETLGNLGYDFQIYNLKDRKQRAEIELAELNKKYCELGLSARISGQIASAVNFSKKKIGIFSRIKRFFSKKVLAKLSRKFDYNQTISEALDNLFNINLSVDELINMRAPYGESISRYEKLTAYLNKANILHSQINKNINKITKKG